MKVVAAHLLNDHCTQASHLALYLPVSHFHSECCHLIATWEVWNSLSLSQLSELGQTISCVLFTLLTNPASLKVEPSLESSNWHKVRVYTEFTTSAVHKVMFCIRNHFLDLSAQRSRAFGKVCAKCQTTRQFSSVSKLFSFSPDKTFLDNLSALHRERQREIEKAKNIFLTISFILKFLDGCQRRKLRRQRFLLHAH